MSGAAWMADVPRQFARFIARHRRVVAALLAAAAVGSGLTALRPPAPERVRVLAAARDLAGGTRLGVGALTTVTLRPAAVPKGALRPGSKVAGRLLAGPMRAGEPLTDASLARNALLGSDGLVATPVRIADSAMARMLRAGDHVDVLAAPTRGAMLGEPATVVAASVRVLATPGNRGGRAQGGIGSLTGGALVMVATTPDVAAALASAAVTSRLSVTLRPG